MSGAVVTFTKLGPASGERFQSLRRELGVTSFGINLITLQPRERGRVHAHEHQEEVYLVLEGELTLVLEDGEHSVETGGLARVPAAVRRQLVNRHREPLLLLALGGAHEHIGRDGAAYGSWAEEGAGNPPQEVPLPDDVEVD